VADLRCWASLAQTALGKLCLLETSTACQEQFIEEKLLPSSLNASVHFELASPQFIQHLALLPRYFIALKLLLQAGLELSQLVLLQIAIPFQRQFMFIGLL